MRTNLKEEEEGDLVTGRSRKPENAVRLLICLLLNDHHLKQKKKMKKKKCNGVNGMTGRGRPRKQAKELAPSTEARKRFDGKQTSDNSGGKAKQVSSCCCNNTDADKRRTERSRKKERNCPTQSVATDNNNSIINGIDNQRWWLRNEGHNDRREMIVEEGS